VKEFDGGSEVIDYRVSNAIDLENPVILASNVVGESYTATGLNAGDTYVFKVEARNEFGYS
jgi:hypothetical protein